LSDYPNLLLFIIMIAIPVILNTIQMWVVDNIIKFHKQFYLFEPPSPMIESNPQTGFSEAAALSSPK